MAPDGFFKLRAEDADDLAVISACVQDALVSVRDLVFDRAQRRFTVVANRFRREAAAGPDPQLERTVCAIAFTGVEGVAYRGFRRRDDERILSLLAIRAADGAIELDFSEGAGVRLKTPAIQCFASDMGEPWPTLWHPDHPDDAP